jgi:sugar (pentulose or hexulose) kinase
MLILGIDAGTSMTKCALFEPTGEEIAIVRRKVPYSAPHLGWAEHDMATVQQATFSAIGEAVNLSHVRNERIAAVGITGQSAGTFIIDKDLKPVKAILWRDTRAKTLVQELAKNGIGEKFQELTGWPFLPDFAPVQLAWLKKNEPETLARGKWIIGCIDWIAYHLTSKLKVVSTAVIACINPKDLTYDKRILDLLNVSECSHLFPTELVDPSEVVGTVSNKASSETGLEAGTPVVSAGYDQTCNTLGAGGAEAGQAVTILGTAGGNALVTDRYVPTSRTLIACTPHAAPNKWIMLGESHTATPNLDWFIGQFFPQETDESENRGVDVHQFCDERVSSIPAGAGGIIYQPFLYGEVSPFFEPNAKAGFFGIRANQTKYHLLRAIYEGVGYSVRDNYDAISELTNSNVQSIALAGGGAKSPVWAQIIADINNTEVRITNATEIGCKGAAICAAKGLGVFNSIEDAAAGMVKTKAVFRPQSSTRETYERAYAGYRQLRHVLVPIWNS